MKLDIIKQLNEYHDFNSIDKIKQQLQEIVDSLKELDKTNDADLNPAIVKISDAIKLIKA